MTGRPTNREAAGLVAGFALWSLAFVLFYGGHGLVCSSATSIAASSARALLLGAWIAVIAAHVALIVWFVRRFRTAEESLRFVRLASLTLAIVALGATVWTGVPLLSLKIC